ncbi:hypothetical protein ACFL1Y_00730 [Patescibacteria group bacterium]
MSKFFYLCKTNNKKHGLKDQPMKLKTTRKARNTCFYLSIFLVCSIFFIATFYVFNITSSATAGFKISEQKKKVTELKLQNENLKEKANNLGDLKNLQEKADILGLIKISSVEYLDLSDTGVAMK